MIFELKDILPLPGVIITASVTGYFQWYLPQQKLRDALREQYALWFDGIGGILSCFWQCVRDHQHPEHRTAEAKHRALSAVYAKRGEAESLTNKLLLSEASQVHVNEANAIRDSLARLPALLGALHREESAEASDAAIKCMVGIEFRLSCFATRLGKDKHFIYRPFLGYSKKPFEAPEQPTKKSQRLD